MGADVTSDMGADVTSDMGADDVILGGAGILDSAQAVMSPRGAGNSESAQVVMSNRVNSPCHDSGLTHGPLCISELTIVPLLINVDTQRDKTHSTIDYVSIGVNFDTIDRSIGDH